jgi:RNA ligase (TIGR02306 family)
MNNLATIQRVKNVRHHPNADALDLVQVLGWQVVTKRDEYKENDLCIYIVIDTVLPEKPEFEFLRNKHFRIKPIRLRSEESAGICFPLSILPPLYKAMSGPPDEGGEEYYLVKEGQDVTDDLGIKHYEKPIPAELAGQAHGGLPGFLIMTDEDNLRTYPDAIPELYSRPYYITRKDDGCSGTFFIRAGEFGVCSRKIHLKESETNGFWRIAHKYDIEKALRAAFPNMDIALQGELVGPEIQKNKLGLKELELHVFNLFDIKSRTYMDYKRLVDFTQANGIPMVTTLEEGSVFHYTLEELIKFANEQKYPTGGPAEGIVIRPQEGFNSLVLKKSWSGKVISENYKEKD